MSRPMDKTPPISDELVPPFLELMQTLRAMCGGDLEKNIIMLAIAERTYRHPDVRGTTHDQRLGSNRTVFPNTGLNALSIAESSGIPRETVRRKVASLIDAGWIGQDGRNLHYTPAGYRAMSPGRDALVQLAVTFSEIVQRRRGGAEKTTQNG
jgi:hypothetical protein